jgi:signal transduction histidine kinase
LPSPERSSRRSRLTFGLRPRLLGALVLTSVVTLGVAALTLLPPLKSRLRNDALTQTVVALETAKEAIGRIALVHGLPPHQPLNRLAVTLKHNSDEERVIVWTRGLKHAYEDTDRDEPLLEARSLAALALSDRASRFHPVHEESGNYLLVASPYHDKHHVFVLELFTKLNYVDQATDVVSIAFLEAAGAGLLVALLLGAALSSRLVRRLRMLRDAAGELDERGLRDLGMADSLVHDEIGELAREFAQMRARLRAQEQARRAFVATASHELRTPLTSLDGMLELLADDLESEPPDVEDARERVARAQQQSRRLSSLASDLLDLSRLDAELELRSEPVELGELARAVSAEFELRAAERRLSVEIEGADGQHWVQGDPAGLARIVRILLDNALRIAPTDTMISIRVDSEGDRESLEVADHGPGVSPEERELIFERFQRGRDHGGEAGFGLGLAIGRELAKRMAGRLLLVPGTVGASFRLELPAARGANAE